MGPHDVALLDPNEIAPHAIAFARLMFAHAALRRVVPLIGRRHQSEEARVWRVTRESMDSIYDCPTRRGEEFVTQWNFLLTRHRLRPLADAGQVR